jgi:hypothetical protein
MVSSVSVDMRTRTEADIRAVDPAAFFGEELPALAARHGDLAVPGALELGVEPFSFVVGDDAWTLSLTGTGLRVEAGDHGAAAIELDAAELADFVNDLQTPMTLVAAGTLRMRRGDLGDALDWWVVLRSLLDARPAHTRGAVGFHDRDGGPLDLARAFTPDDDDAEIAHFLAEAGFLHLRGWFDPDVMREIAADVAAAAPSYAPGDGRSWWATTASGEQRCVRMQWFHEHSPATAELIASDRLARIGRLTGDGHVYGKRAGNVIEALVKPIGVVKGISDLPWHKDCSLGRHSYRCSGLTVGISVTGADARSGQLAVVAGSHRALVQPAFVRREWGLPVVDLPTETGDATVHCSCTLHMSHPPIDRERMVMYTGFGLPDLADTVSGGRDLSAVREGAHKVVSQQPGHVA